MATGREADHPDPLRVDSPFRGAAADEADGPLGVEQRAQGRLASDITRTPRYTVLEDDAGHAERVQPRRHFLSLELPIKIPVPAPRTDHHRRSRVLVLGRLVDRERRLGDIGNQLGRTDDWRLMNAADFLAIDADVSGRLPRPEIDDQRICRE